MFVEALNKLCEVGKGTGQPIDLIDNNNINFAVINIPASGPEEQAGPYCRLIDRHHHNGF